MAHSGVRLVFRARATSIRLVAQARARHMDCKYDLCSGGQLLGTVHRPALQPLAKPWHELEAFLADDPAASLLEYGVAAEASKAADPPPAHEVVFAGLDGAADTVYELWLPQVAAGETVILLHPPPPPLRVFNMDGEGMSAKTDSFADGHPQASSVFIRSLELRGGADLSPVQQAVGVAVILLTPPLLHY